MREKVKELAIYLFELIEYFCPSDERSDRRPKHNQDETVQSETSKTEALQVKLILFCKDLD